MDEIVVWLAVGCWLLIDDSFSAHRSQTRVVKPSQPFQRSCGALTADSKRERERSPLSASRGVDFGL